MAFFREPSDDEINLSGFDGPDIVVTAWSNTYGTGSGGGGGSTHTDVPYESVFPPPSDIFGVAGLIDCPPFLQAFNSALMTLHAASPTAATMISDLQRTPFYFYIVSTDVASTNQSNRQITWDPFASVIVLDDNQNPTGGLIPPLIALAHEIAHAIHPGYSEAQIRGIETAVVNEYNASVLSWQAGRPDITPYSQSATRTNDLGSYQNTTNFYTTIYDINTPQPCVSNLQSDAGAEFLF